MSNDLPTYSASSVCIRDDYERNKPLTEKISIQASVTDRDSGVVFVTSNPAMALAYCTCYLRPTAIVFLRYRIHAHQRSKVAGDSLSDLPAHDRNPTVKFCRVYFIIVATDAITPGCGFDGKRTSPVGAFDCLPFGLLGYHELTAILEIVAGCRYW